MSFHNAPRYQQQQQQQYHHHHHQQQQQNHQQQHTTNEQYRSTHEAQHDNTIKQNFLKIKNSIAGIEQRWLMEKERITTVQNGLEHTREEFGKESFHLRNEFYQFRRQFYNDLTDIFSRLKSLEGKETTSNISDESEISTLQTKVEYMINLGNSAKEKLDKFDATASFYEEAINHMRTNQEKMVALESENSQLKERLLQLELRMQQYLQPVILPIHNNSLKRTREEEEEIDSQSVKKPHLDNATIYSELVKKAYNIPPTIDWTRVKVLHEEKYVLLKHRIQKERWFISNDKFTITSRGTHIYNEYCDEFMDELGKRYSAVVFDSQFYPFVINCIS